MNLTMRKFQSEEDFWRIRTLAREVFLLNDRLERSWSTPRVDYWRWHFIKTVETHPMDQVTFLWETTEGQLVATILTLFSETYLIVHPDFRSAELENEIVSVIKCSLIVPVKISVSPTIVLIGPMTLLTLPSIT